MKVKVIPQRPIPGILPKNKWIDQEMECDLNKAEIIRCMQYGTVCDIDGKVIDTKYLQEFPMHEIHKPVILTTSYNPDDITIIEQISNNADNVSIVDQFDNKAPEVYTEVYTTVSEGEQIIIQSSSETEDAYTTDTESEGEQIIIQSSSEVSENVIVNEEKVEKQENNILEFVSCVKEDEYIIVETQYNSETLTGDLSGSFVILAGSRPTMEFKSEDEWVKFNSKFKNYSSIENGQKFVFRLLPKNNSVLKFRLSIKESNNIIVKLEGNIDPSNL